MLAIIIVLVFVALMFLVSYLKKLNFSFNARVMIGLLTGIVFGFILQFAVDKETVSTAMSWISTVGSAYVRLLKMIVMPLIFVSLTKAIATQERGMGKSAIRIVAVLMVTVFISAILSALVSSAFGLDAQGLTQGDAELKKAEALITRSEDFASTSIQDKILNVIPDNPFAALAGQGQNATLSVVFFAAISGFTILMLKTSKEKSANGLIEVLNLLSDFVMKMVQIVLRLTPYGVMALIANVAATSDWSQIAKLVIFILASYLAMLLMFAVHGLMVGAVGLNPITFFRKSGPNFLMAFTSRSSAGTLPLTITNMEKNLGVPEGIANLAGTLGTCIGQNGCAGVYPAMLAVMIAPTLGIDPLAPAFLLKLAVVITISSFGIAGVGGGATFAAIVVLSTLGFPLELAGLLVSIEPLIDMGRTALNVSDSVLAGVISAKLGKSLNTDIYNSKKIFSGDTNEL